MKTNRMTAFCLILFLSTMLNSWAGTVTRTPEGKTRIQVVSWYIPDPAKTDANNRAEYAVHQEFLKRFPAILEKKYRAKYESNPQKYGDFS